MKASSHQKIFITLILVYIRAIKNIVDRTKQAVIKPTNKGARLTSGGRGALDDILGVDFANVSA
jgi:hypothetical protein